jgi:hypothetical protein
MTIFQVKIGKVLTVCAMLGVSLMSALPSTAKSVSFTADGTTGCTSGTSGKCYGFPSPNDGIIWVGTWMCNYNTSGNLTSATGYACNAKRNGECCNTIDTSSAGKCPVMGCPSRLPAQMEDETEPIADTHEEATID